MKLQLAMSALALGAPPAQVLPRPPMGFNNWARFQTDIRESIFLEAAQTMRASGLLTAGYNRINLDDAWSLPQRALNGSMAWDLAKFPHGLTWLAGELRRMGFEPGIYTDAGHTSCGAYPGALDNEERDLGDFRAWGYDYVKVDGCNLPDTSEATYRQVYGRWQRLVAAARRPVIFSNSAPAYFSGTDNLTDWYTVMGWASRGGHLARHSADIQVYPEGDVWASMMYNYGMHVRLARFQRPGFFNDPDFLNVDHPGYSLEERKTHFALWCAFSAPLIISADMKRLITSEIAYLTNRNLLAVNQDRLVQQATLVSRDETWDVLSKSLDNGDRLLVVFNKGTTPSSLHITWGRMGYDSRALSQLSAIQIKNLWTGQVSQPEFWDGIQVSEVPGHGTAVLRISTGRGSVTPTGIIFNTASLRCLADSEPGQVRLVACSGTDAQTWRVDANGRVSSLMRPGKCLQSGPRGRVVSTVEACRASGWWYGVSGNLMERETGLCLTEDANKAAVVAPCGNLVNEQVFGLPVGVMVEGI
ncbi:hypothetical protein CDD82_1420 [Ophiocordyceps australis]|uniref:Alpha-galactosidase n=1 Tax=Ophiocordyceps australis TaxID=1399860 RepID=A0A2C5YFI6_9HYPO|nr:hypothetical protein CDD82_1420 [Ophiocordyceps australis]